MKISHLIILFIAILSSTDLYGQNQYDLSDYKFPDVRRQKLDIYFNSEGNASSEKMDSVEKKNNSLGGYLRLSYSDYLSTRKEQRTTYVDLDVSVADRKWNNYSDNQSEAFRGGVNIHHNQLFFHKRLHYGGDFYFQYYHRYQWYENIYDTLKLEETFKDDDIDIALPLKVGYGRVEPVSDYRMAIYVYEDLKNNGKVAANKSEEDIMQLASLISKLRSERIYDHRLSKMRHLKAIDAYLKENNYLVEQDIDYFNILNDYWDYGFHASRSSGFIASAVFYPSYSLNFHDRKDSEDTSFIERKSTALGLGGGIEIDYFKPINLNWQSNLFLDSYIGSSELGGDDYDSINYKYPNYFARIGHQIAYYPNTRTSISFSYSLDYSKLFNATHPLTEENNLEASNFAFSASAKVYYYFSERLWAEFYAGISQLLNESEERVYPYQLRNTFPMHTRIAVGDQYYLDRRFGLNYRLNIVYSIF